MAASRTNGGLGTAKVFRDSSRKESGGEDWVSFDYVFRQKSFQGSAPPTQHQEPPHAGVPVHIRPFVDHDDISDVSNVSNSTPFSVATNQNSPCEVLPTVQGPRHMQFPEAGLASTAAIFMNQVVTDVLDNVTSSIDPSVLLQFQGRTRSLVRRSLSMVRDMNSRQAEMESSSDDLNNGEHIYHLPPATEVHRPLFAASESRDDKARRLPLWSLLMPSHSQQNKLGSIQHKDSPSERCGVEVSSEGGIIDFGQLGEEIEISRYHASVVLDSRNMNTEVTFHKDQHEDDSNCVETQIVKHPAIKQVDHRRKLAVPRLFRTKSQDQPSSLKDSGNSEVHREVTKSRPRGSAKTVSTMHSDESTTAMQSMHTDGSGWIQDPSIVRILQC
jgi:hypothetical protein